MMEMPRNCRECGYANGCKSYYGGSMCKHKEEIILAAKAAMEQSKENVENGS